MKESFLMYNSFYMPVEGLSYEEKGRLWDAVFRYHAFGELMELPPVCQMAFNFMKNQFDRDSEKYQAIVDRNRSNGVKGGRPGKNPDEPRYPSGLIGNPDEPKKADTVSESVSESVSDNDTEEIPLNPLKGKKSKSIDLGFIDPEYLDIVKDWLAYKAEKKQAYKGAKSIQTFFEKLKELSCYNSDTAKKIIEQSMANNWAGIFELKIERKSKSSIPENKEAAAGIVSRYMESEQNYNSARFNDRFIIQ